MCEYAGPAWPKDASPEIVQASSSENPYSAVAHAADLTTLATDSELALLPEISPEFTDQWDLQPIPFSGLLDLPGWGSSQDWANTISQSNCLLGSWPLDKPDMLLPLIDSTYHSPSISSAALSDGRRVVGTRSDSTSKQRVGEDTFMTGASSTYSEPPAGPHKVRDDSDQRMPNDGKEFILSICASLNGTPWWKIPILELPSKKAVEQYVELYFVHVHPVSYQTSTDQLARD